MGKPRRFAPDSDPAETEDLSERSANRSDEFLELIPGFQGRLFAFILSLTGDPDQANEILQEANLVLWQKSSEFQLGTSFKAWSFRVAHFQVLSYRQRQIRDRLIFDDDTLASLAQDSMAVDTDFELQLERLQVCLSRLSDRDRGVLSDFYDRQNSIAEIASRMNRTAGAIGQLLFRIRQRLLQCMTHQPAGAAGGN